MWLSVRFFLAWSRGFEYWGGWVIYAWGGIFNQVISVANMRVWRVTRFFGFELQPSDGVFLQDIGFLINGACSRWSLLRLPWHVP